MKGYSLRDMKELLLIPFSYWRGIKLMRSRKWAEAIVELKKALSDQPNNSFINFKLGFCYMKLEKWELSYNYLSKAISYNKNRATWQKQYYRVEKELPVNQSKKKKSRTTTSKAKQPKKMNSSETIELANFQLALLKCDHQVQYDFSAFIRQVFSDKFYSSALCEHQFFLNKLTVYFESIINDTEYCSELLQKEIDLFFEGSKEIIEPSLSKYLEASYLYRIGSYSKALEVLLELIAQYPKKNVMHYLLAVSSAINLFEYELAYDLSIEVAQFSRRALIWKYRHITSSLTCQWVDIYRSYLLETSRGRLSLGNLQVLNNVVDTLINAKEYDLALGIVRKSADFISQHPNPPKLVRQTLKYSTESFVPEWSEPFTNLEREKVTKNLNRFKKVLIDSYKLLENHNIHVGIKSSSLNIDSKEYELNSAFVENIEICIFNLETLETVEEIINASGLYTLAGIKHDKHVLYYKHRLGITIELTLYKKASFGELAYYQNGALTVVNDSIILEKYTYEGLSLNVLDTSSLTLIKESYESDAESIMYTYLAFICARINGDEVEALHLKTKLRKVDQNHPFEEVSENVGCDIQTLEYLENYRPEVVLYLSGLENVAYQGNMWLPVLERLPCRVAIVIREVRIADQFKKTDIPVFFMRNMRELELLEESGVKTILYPANTQKNIQTLRFFQLNHFFINHGESDKVVNQSKFLMAYDKLLVAGPLAEKRLYDAGLPVRDGQVIHVGRPQVELLLEQITEPIKKVKTILYAPTWEGFVEEANYSSVSEFGMQMLQQLVDGDTKIYFKPHPYTGHNKNGDTGEYLEKMIYFSKSNGIEIVDSREPIFDYMNMCDLLITDVSSVLNDFLYTKKPMLLTNPKNIETEELHISFPSSPATYNLNDPNQVSTLIESIEENDYLWDVRQGILIESLGDIPEGYLERFKTIVMESLY